MPHFVRSYLSRKLLLAVGIPAFVVSLVGVVWLGSGHMGGAPWRWGPMLAYLGVLVMSTSMVLMLAVHLLLERPLSRIVASLRRAEVEDFLLRVPVESDDELGALARSFNTALATITDLHARRLDDAQSIESMQRELALKAEVEEQHRLLDAANRNLEERVRELTVLSDLARTFNSTLEVEELVHVVTRVVGQSLGFEHLALLLLEEQGDLVVKSVHGIQPDAEGWRVRLGQGIAGTAAQEKQVVLVRDTKADGRFPAQRFTGGRQGSLLAVPMVFRGESVGVMDFFRPVVDGFGEDELSFLQSVANQAAMAISNARLHERTVALSLTDSLTGLHNRRSLFGRLDMELERSQRFAHGFAAVMIDVDHFKALNDELGHSAGDAVLCQISGLFGGAIRKIDTVARYGGEEFMLLLPRADRAAAVQVAEKLRQLVAETRFRPGAGLSERRMTISAGVAVYPDDARELTALIDCADAALFAAKHQGRDRVVVHHAGMREDPHRRRDARTAAVAEPGGAVG